MRHALLALVLLIPAVLCAQGSGNSVIAGTVRDSSGGVLPGATVEVASPVLIEKTRTAVTDDQGQYRIVELRPGTYTVSFTLAGFGTVTHEGIELPANFTAAVNGELKVGGIEESVTVSGQTPLVDVQDATQQKTLSNEVINSVPNAKAIIGFAALVPAVVLPPTGQDVGGSKGQISIRMSIHGGKQQDQKLLLDGMRYNAVGTDGTARGYTVNPASSQEVVLDVAGGGSAEFSTGGVQVNVVPKDGGNRFSADVFANYGSSKFQGDNLTAELQAQGLKTVNKIDQIYDLNGGFGGPILRDKLWFYTAHRKSSTKAGVANLYAETNVNDWAFTPDLSRPVFTLETLQSNNIRLTWQAARKQKFTFFYDRQDYQPTGGVGFSLTSSIALEAAPTLHYFPNSLTQATWSYATSNRLFFEAGVSYTLFEPSSVWTVPRDLISVLDTAVNLRYRSPGSFTYIFASPTNGRLSASYVTGSHNFKAGTFFNVGSYVTNTLRTPPVSYNFFNGTPVQLTEYAAPIMTRETMRPELALYVQDQWTSKRLTLKGGLRFEYLRAYVPASQQPAGLFLPARNFGGVDCVPCWTDLDPRFGAAYDLFGNGRTAVKASVGRYVESRTTGIASLANPVNASVNQVNRVWNDNSFPLGDPRNGNFVPDCNLLNPLANGECGPISNLNFGQTNIVTHYDPAEVNGWGKRGYNWQTSALIDHQFGSSVAASAGFFRTWYGNFTVTDNLDTTPSDYSPFCINAPVNAQLPGGGGNQICGQYDVNRSLFAKVNNLITRASNFGKFTEVYKGVDLNATWRSGNGRMLSGGVTIGNSNSTGGSLTSSHTNRCFVVNSPGELYQCDVAPPYRPQFKSFGVYPLPWDARVSANYQNLPGTPITATYQATNAEIAPSLGRNLSACPMPTGVCNAQVPIELIAPFSLFEKRINQVDFRLSKIFRIGHARLEGLVDVYNALNASSILSENTAYGTRWLQPTEITNARLVKFGVQLQF
jgi:hypothetical protein